MTQPPQGEPSHDRRPLLCGCAGERRERDHERQPSIAAATSAPPGDGDWSIEVIASTAPVAAAMICPALNGPSRPRCSSGPNV